MRTPRMFWSFILCLATVVTGACAAGNVAPITAPTRFTLDYQGTGSVAVAARDQREDILNGDRKETMVGHQRSLYGIPYPVANASGRPFARDFTDLIVSGLKAKGVAATSVQVSPFKPEDAAVSALVATGSDRNLLFNIVQWDADTYNRTTLHYDIRLAVYDKKGNLLGQTASAGEDDLGRGRTERADLSIATADIIQTLLIAKPVVAALQPSASAPSKACTVDQILKMQESGLSRQQIEAACPSVSGGQQ